MKSAERKPNEVCIRSSGRAVTSEEKKEPSFDSAKRGRKGIYRSAPTVTGNWEEEGGEHYLCPLPQDVYFEIDPCAQEEGAKKEQ